MKDFLRWRADHSKGRASLRVVRSLRTAQRRSLQESNSLGLLGIVEVVLLLPLGLNRQLWFYVLVLALWWLAGWFPAGSILFQLRALPIGS